MGKRLLNLFWCLLLMFFFLPLHLDAAEVVVVESIGMDLHPGQVLDGGRPLALTLGQRVTLVASDGRMIKLRGPSETAPAPEAEPPKGAVTKSLKDLISTRQADVSSLGVVRAGDSQVALPEGWLLDILHAGSRCIEEGRPPVLWRGSAATPDSQVVVAPVDGSWSAQATWPAGADRLELPASLAFQDRHTYTVTVDGGSVQMTVFVIPRTLGSEAAKAAWMVEMRCDSQAKALLAGSP